MQTIIDFIRNFLLYEECSVSVSRNIATIGDPILTESCNIFFPAHFTEKSIRSGVTYEVEAEVRFLFNKSYITRQTIYKYPEDAWKVYGHLENSSPTVWINDDYIMTGLNSLRLTLIEKEIG